MGRKGVSYKLNGRTPDINVQRKLCAIVEQHDQRNVRMLLRSRSRSTRASFMGHRGDGRRHYGIIHENLAYALTVEGPSQQGQTLDLPDLGRQNERICA